MHFACVFALFFLNPVFFCVFSFFRFSLLFFFFVFRCFSLFFVVFLCFSFSFQEISVFSAYFQAVAVDCPSVFGYGETAKTLQKREFRSDPVYTNPGRNFPSDAPFSRLRPNDPSSGLTNDTREGPITESSRPITKTYSPKIWFLCLRFFEKRLPSFYEFTPSCDFP